MVGCPLMCTYCPQTLVRGQYSGQKYFQLEDFKHAVFKLPMDVRVDFSGMAEPFANPQTEEMMYETLDRGYDIALFTTLQGLQPSQTLTVVDMLEKYAKQVKTVYLHLPDAQGNMVGFKYNEAYAYALRSFLQLGEKGLFRFECMTMGDLHPQLEPFGIRLNAFKPISRAENVDRTKIKGAQPKKVLHRGPITCHKYYQNVLMPNGDVYLCCMDYGLQHKLGNLLTQEYEDICAAAYTISQLNLTNDSKTICRNCSRAKPA